MCTSGQSIRVNHWTMHRIEILDKLVRYKSCEEDSRADHHEQSTIPVNQRTQRMEFARTLIQRRQNG